MINSVVKYLEETVKNSPEKTFVIHNGKKTTFKEFHQKSIHISSRLTKFGTKKPIAIYLEKSDLTIVSFFATLYSGNFYTPIDIKNPIRRAKAVLDELETRVVLTNTKHYETALENFKNVEVINIEEVLKEDPEQELNYIDVISKTIDTDPMYCFFTSGSTGKPKGVVISHKSISNYIQFALKTFKINSSTHFGNQSQFHFDISGLDIYCSIAAGATINIIPESLFMFPGKLIEYIRSSEINYLFWVPTAFNYLAKTNALENASGLNIEHFLFCGEPMPISTLKYMQKHLPTSRYSNLYGPTEATISCTHFTVERSLEDDESIPIGNDDINTNILVFDENNNLIESNTPGIKGELCVRGCSLALGYWRNHDATNEKFIQNPLHQNYPERIYKTGDIVEYNTRGELIYIGRVDNQIKHMGYRIELEEIEKKINSLDYIEASCSIYDAIKQEIICAYSTVEGQEQKRQIAKDSRDILPVYMIPRKFVHFTQLPTGSTGKIDRKLIKNGIINGKSS